MGKRPSVAFKLCTRWSSSSILSIHQRIMHQIDPFPKNSTRHKWIVWTTGKHHQRSIDSRSCRTRGKWYRKTNTSSSQAWWARPDKSSRNHQDRIRLPNSDHCYTTDKFFNRNLDLDYNALDQQYIRHTKNRIWHEKNAKWWNSHDELWEELTPEPWQLIKGTMEKGASSWLSALPTKAIGYALNKQEFMDAVCMTFGWKVKGIPTHCACGETNSVDHNLICKLVGNTSVRHNSVRDSEAQIKWERSIEMFRPNPHFCQSTKMTLKEKSTVLTMQCWICLWEDCGIAVRKLSLTKGSHILPQRLIMASPQQRSTKSMKTRRITKEWWTLRSLHSIPLSLQQVEGWHQSQQKTGRKNSWKIQRAICIYHAIHKDKAQICPFQEHPHCNARISRQTKRCPPLGPHGHWLQFNS